MVNIISHRKMKISNIIRHNFMYTGITKSKEIEKKIS